ncbi:MAG TPA: ABC transporter substrate-binding protein, partial [Thermoanaerobaculia bacterium]|nr:ABC transporter substrate-binding protein [Thermoanaerobaculia bacterium]
MTKRRPIQLATLALLVAGLNASPLLAQGKTFKVGVPLPLTGAEAKFGEMEKQAYEMAVEEINAKGGVKGMKLALDIQDS